MTDQETPHDPDLEFERQEDYGQDYHEPQAGEGEAYAEAGEEYADELPPVEEKPKSNLLFNIGVFGGVGIFALVMAWINFGSVLFPPKNAAITNNNALLNPQTPTAKPAPTVVNNANPAVPAPAQPVPANPSGPVVLNNGQSTAPAANSAPTDVANLSVTPNAPVTPPPTVVPTSPSSPAAPVGTVATTALPSGGPTVLPSPTPIPANPAMVAASPAASPANAADAAKLDELQKQNQDLTAKTAEQESAIADLKSQLADAQSRLSDAQSQLAQAQAAAQAAQAVQTAPKPKKTVKKSAPPHHAIAQHKSTTVPPPATLSNNSSAAPATPSGNLTDNGTLPSPPPYWVLRSAADNSAWVAHPGDNQLYQVTVGDQLPGVGKITSIQQQNGAWVVVGTQSQIHQE